MAEGAKRNLCLVKCGHSNFGGSCHSECTFSTFSWMHSTTRNRLFLLLFFVCSKQLNWLIWHNTENWLMLIFRGIKRRQTIQQRIVTHSIKQIVQSQSKKPWFITNVHSRVLLFRKEFQNHFWASLHFQMPAKILPNRSFINS